MSITRDPGEPVSEDEICKRLFDLATSAHALADRATDDLAEPLRELAIEATTIHMVNVDLMKQNWNELNEESDR